jgi:uncharacterized membrane protein
MIDFIKISPERDILKTISYRIVSSVIGFFILWIFFGITVGAAFGIIELVWKPIQYYIHERVWYKHIKFGLTKTKISENKDLVVDSPIDINLEVNTTSPKRLVYTKKT